ncbi:MAG: hypothetical protein KDC73_01280 [Ignavibacteriae bacterium]|nr:hypothetical protein [Ignavibacteriota bacterium]MCB0723307.1 hypothetical protein [Ignavibacteriota bacterium]MCB9243153.1 hypothetical protein [Ignavibacteriales bacterium]
MIKTLIFVLTGLLLLSYNANAQSKVTDNNFKFSIFLASDWTKTKVEETPKKDAISYSFDNTDGSNALMILAFKVNGVKDIDDFIYNLEKDIGLNISPKTSTGYTSKDFDSYQRKMALYGDDQVVETIYYYTTNNEGATENYAYVLRFITLKDKYNSTVAKEIEEIAGTFEPL